MVTALLSCERRSSAIIFRRVRCLPSLVSHVRKCWSRFKGSRYLAEVKDRETLISSPVRVFDGYLVRKDLVRKYSRQYPVPTYVVEFLLGRYCASIDEKEIAEGLEIVEKQLRDRTVRTGEEELFKARARESGTVKLIDIVRARLDAKNDCYVAELPSLALRDVRIHDQLVRDNERMLTDGFYAEVTVSYDA